MITKTFNREQQDHNTMLYVDDERPCPKGYDLARTYDEAIEKLTNNKYTFVSLDHDLGCYYSDGSEKTGYDIAKWLLERRMSGHDIPQFSSHSMNPIGRRNIDQTALQCLRYEDEEDEKNSK